MGHSESPGKLPRESGVQVGVGAAEGVIDVPHGDRRGSPCPDALGGEEVDQGDRIGPPRNPDQDGRLLGDKAIRLDPAYGDPLQRGVAWIQACGISV